MRCKTLLLLLTIQAALLPLLYSQTNEQLRANLYTYNADSTLALNDGNLTLYNVNNSNDVDRMDAVKLTNFGENFGLLRGNKTLVVERRHSITSADTIFFNMWNLHEKNYTIILYLTGLAHPNMRGVLEDKYLNTATELNLNGITTAAFTITGDVASLAADRFRIIFSTQAPLTVLPVASTSIKAYCNNLPNGQAGKNINLEWSVENEKDITKFDIEKSINGQQFFTASSIYVKDKTLAGYKWTDKAAGKGNNFYRIKSINVNGKMQYSNVTNVFIETTNSSFSVFPNPVINDLVTIQMSDQPKGIYLTRVISQNGQLLHSAQIKYNGGSNTKTIQLNNTIGKGNYILEIVTPGKNVIIRRIFIQ